MTKINKLKKALDLIPFREKNSSSEEIDIEVQNEEQTIVDLFDQFANVHLNGPVVAETINPIVEFILRTNLSDGEEGSLKVINLFIDSEGGDVQSAMKLIDSIRMSEIPIRTIGWGKVESAGLMIFMAGRERLISKNCSILSHNAVFSAQSYAVRVNDFSHQEGFKLIYEKIMRVYKECTGRDERYIKKYLLKDNDVYMTAESAIKHGIADGVIPEGMAWLKSYNILGEGT